MKVLLPDGSDVVMPEGATATDVAESIGPRLAKAALAAKIGDQMVDLGTPLADGDQVAIITASSPEGLDVIRHSAAHLLAEAAIRLYPGTKVAIGPAIKDGFYYDFEFPRPVGEDDLSAITAEMERLVAARLPFERREVSRGGGPRTFPGRTLQGGTHPRSSRRRHHQRVQAGGVPRPLPGPARAR